MILSLCRAGSVFDCTVGVSLHTQDVVHKCAGGQQLIRLSKRSGNRAAKVGAGYVRVAGGCISAPEASPGSSNRLRLMLN
jgi:hypothetical protein